MIQDFRLRDNNISNKMSQLSSARVPVGFRFHPTDEELVGYYLPKKVGALKIDLDLIRDLDLYKLEPWDLQDLCKIQSDTNEKQTDYYFFSRKDKKYPTGNRANRATTKGFWKATGRDKPIHTKLQTLIGMRKTLVFYQGRAPHGMKTDWIMHEFRLDDGPGRPAHEDGGWVVCRVFKKNKNLKMKTQERACSFEEQVGLLPEMSSPDILSGGGSGTCSYGFPSFNHHHNSSGYGNNNRNNFKNINNNNNNNNNIKQEVINLDEYTTTSDHQHNQYFQTPMLKMENTIAHSMPSTSEYRCYLHRTLSLKKDDYLIDPYVATTTETSSLSDFNQQQVDDEEAISGLESLDWNALCEAPGRSDLLRLPANASSPALPKNVDPAPVLLHLKRQNSDIFSSLELWNYSQIAQEL